MKVSELVVATTLGVTTVGSVVGATVGTGLLVARVNESTNADKKVQVLDDLHATGICDDPRVDQGTRAVESRLGASEIGSRVASVALQDCATDTANPYSQIVITVTHPQGNFDLVADPESPGQFVADVATAIQGVDATDRSRLDQDLTLPITETAQAVSSDGPFRSSRATFWGVVWGAMAAVGSSWLAFRILDGRDNRESRRVDRQYRNDALTPRRQRGSY